MTCVVGLVKDGVVYIGSDSAGVNDNWDLTLMTEPKVFHNGDLLIGFTGSFRIGQLLRYALVPPDRKRNMDVYRYMVTVFTDAVRQCLKDGGCSRKEDEVESGGNFLVGYQGRLFEIWSDYQVDESRSGMSAVGCGCQYALGSLFTSVIDVVPESRVRQALQAAEHFSAGVRQPFVVESI